MTTEAGKIALALVAEMSADNGCKFVPTVDQLMALEAGVVKMMKAGCVFTKEVIEQFASGETTYDLEPLIQKYDGLDASLALNKIFDTGGID